MIDKEKFILFLKNEINEIKKECEEKKINWRIHNEILQSLYHIREIESGKFDINKEQA